MDEALRNSETSWLVFVVLKMNHLVKFEILWRLGHWFSKIWTQTKTIHEDLHQSVDILSNQYFAIRPIENDI